MFKMNKERILAIDLAPDAVRVLDVKQKKTGPQVDAFASQSVAAGSIETLPERQLTALGSLIAAQRLKTKRYVAALPTSLVVTRSVAIDSSKPQTPDEQIRWTLQKCLPFDPKDLMFDFWPVGEPKPGARTRDVLVVATQQSIVKRYLDGFEKIGLTCDHLDVAPCAMASLIAHAATNVDGMVGTIAIAETSGYFAIIEKQQVLFWRPFEIPAAAQKSISAAQAGLDRVGDEISKCVSHMVGSMHLDNLTELLVFGNGSDDAAFASYLNNRFHLTVRAPSPFDIFSTDSLSPSVRSAVQPQVATHFAAAVGLAMQPAGVAIHG
jgi:Tfp pilus assembly PilM family ATPase